MKKNYIKPAVQVIEIDTTQLIAASQQNARLYMYDGAGNEIDNIDDIW